MQKRLQSDFEERLNTYTHAFGAVLGLVGLVLLTLWIDHQTPLSLLSVSIYGLSIVTLFTASTLYHYSTKERNKHYFRIVDHVSIYILIAGTYTPVVLLGLSNSLGWELFIAVWCIAALGLILKIFFTGRYEAFSTLLYVVMGWLIVFDFANVSDFLGPNGVLLLFAGGLFYTVGIIFYAIHKIPFNHVIWHFFVLFGAICHFFMIYLYVV